MQTGRPKLVFIAGASRWRVHLEHWRDRLSDFDVRFVDLPGHGGSPVEVGPPSIPTLAAAVAGRLPDGPLILIGESLGGLVAFALADLAVGVIAVDPPLTMAKQWALRESYRPSVFGNPDPRTKAWLEEIFGLYAERYVERDYRGLLVPGAQVITGTIPLQPPRRYSVTPCMLEEADVDDLRARGLTVHRVDGVGHVALSPEASDATEPVLRRALGHLA